MNLFAFPFVSGIKRRITLVANNLPSVMAMFQKSFRLWIVLVFILTLLWGCSEPRNHQAPYTEHFQVGLFGHGDGLFGELKLNYWGVVRRCDSCHAIMGKVHPNLGSCNSCHQPHNGGWKPSTMALYHENSFAFVGREYHFDLKCSECHNRMNSRVEFRQTQCVQCHNHSARDIKFAHELMDDFNLDKEYRNQRCVACHAKAGEEYQDYYDPETNELL